MTINASKEKVNNFSERKKDAHIGKIIAALASMSKTVVLKLAVEPVSFR